MRLENARSMTLLAMSLMSGFARTTRAALAVCGIARVYSGFALSLAAALFVRGPRRQDVYNVLWAAVFGFATLNILSLAARRFEPGRRGLSFGELLAVMVVFVSVFLLGWEMLTLFHIFPIQIRR